MSKFIVKRDVPILDEHVLRDDEGNPLVTFDEKELKRIAARNNRRIKQTGDLIPLVIGHTKDDAPEETQPEIVGYAKDLRVKPFKKTGRKAITAKFFYFKDKVKKARGFPRRSIELWLSDGKIDPISLLGATTPERDLGLVQLEKSGAVLQFASGGRRKYKRLLDDAKPDTERQVPMDEKAIVAAVMKALEQSAVWKWAEGKMKEDEATEEEPGLEGDLGEEEMPEELGGEPGLEGEEMPEDLPEEEEEEADEPEGEEPVRYNMGGACPSGSNTFTPSYGATNKNPSNMHKKPAATSNNKVQSKGKLSYGAKSGTQKMARNRGEDRLVRYQRAVQKQARELQDMRIRFQRAERERDLMELSAQGYEFDPVEELDYVSQLPEDHYQYHLGRIKKRYQRAPIGDARFDLGMSRNPTPSGANNSREQAQQIQAYALKKGISYEDAMGEFEGEQTF